MSKKAPLSVVEGSIAILEQLFLQVRVCRSCDGAPALARLSLARGWDASGGSFALAAVGQVRCGPPCVHQAGGAVACVESGGCCGAAASPSAEVVLGAAGGGNRPCVPACAKWSRAQEAPAGAVAAAGGKPQLQGVWTEEEMRQRWQLVVGERAGCRSGGGQTGSGRHRRGTAGRGGAAACRRFHACAACSLPCGSPPLRESTENTGSTPPVPNRPPLVLQVANRPTPSRPLVPNAARCRAAGADIGGIQYIPVSEVLSVTPPTSVLDADLGGTVRAFACGQG